LAQTTDTGAIARFGEFVVDLRQASVRRNGTPVAIQEKPLQLLLALLDKPGQLVSREELCGRLWPGDTFGAFEDGLNTAVRKLRIVLGDSAEVPQFIETVPKRGYRFIGTLEHSTQPETAPPLESGSKSGSPPYRRLATVLSVAAALAIAVAGVLHSSRPHPGLTEKDVIVLTDFSNRTGEPVFDSTLRESLAIGLEQSPFLNVLSDIRANQTLKLMGRSPGDRITEDVGREICVRTSSKALLTGSISRLDSQYAMELKAINCQTGDTLAAVEADARGRDKVLQSLGQAANRLRLKLGESLPSLQNHSKPLEEVTTSSLEALQAYSDGVAVYPRKGAAEAIPFFRRATELDPNFAAAYTYLGPLYGNLGEILRVARPSSHRLREVHRLRTVPPTSNGRAAQGDRAIRAPGQDIPAILLGS
jgi:DNA-binding winged helix-turn-helix (wHTH) protein